MSERRHEGTTLVILRSHSEGLATKDLRAYATEGTKDLRAYATEGTKDLRAYATEETAIDCHEDTKTRRVDGFRRAHRWGAGEEN